MSTELHIVVLRDDADRLVNELSNIEEIESLQVNEQAPSAKYPLQLDPTWVDVAISFWSGYAANTVYDASKHLAKRLADAIRDGIRIEIIIRRDGETIDLIGLDTEPAARQVEEMPQDPDESDQSRADPDENDDGSTEPDESPK